MDIVTLAASRKYTDKKIAESAAVGIKYEIVDSLPSSGEAQTIYFVKNDSSWINNYYDEYVWISSSGSFEKIGSTQLDDFIQNPSAAEVGQTIVVKEVNEEGKPIAWKMADLPEQVQVDATLTQSGQSADAAVVGQKLGELSEEIELNAKIPEATAANKGQVLSVDADGNKVWANQYAMDGTLTPGYQKEVLWHIFVIDVTNNTPEIGTYYFTSGNVQIRIVKDGAVIAKTIVNGAKEIQIASIIPSGTRSGVIIWVTTHNNKQKLDCYFEDNSNVVSGDLLANKWYISTIQYSSNEVDNLLKKKLNSPTNTGATGQVPVYQEDGSTAWGDVVVPERHVVLLSYDSSTKKHTVNQSYSTMKQWVDAGDTVVLSLNGTIYNLCEQVEGDRLVFTYVRAYRDGQIKIYTANVYTTDSVVLESVSGYMMPNNNDGRNEGLIPVATRNYKYELTDLSNAVIKSSTDGSTKKFKLSVDDNGTISATEVKA